MEKVSDETRTLRRTMRDLVALSALPAVWAGYQPRQIAEGLADALLSTLGLGLVYLRLLGQTEGQEIEVARTAGRPTTTDDTRNIGRALAPCLDGGPTDSAPTILNPAGGGTVRLVIVRIGGDREDGVLVAGSQQTGFPSDADRLLLTVCVNQAAAVLQQQRAAAALRESEEHHRSVIAALQEGVVLLDADGRLRACNASAERILGLSAEEITGRAPLDPRWRAIHEDGTPFSGETHPDVVALRTGQPCSNVVMGVYKPNGELTWITVNSQPLFRPHELTPYAVVTSFSDITGRRRAEEELRRANDRLELGVRGTKIGIWDVDMLDGDFRQGRRYYVNAWEQLGYEHPDFPPDQTPLNETYLHPDDRAAADEAVRRYLTGEADKFEIEPRVLHKDGSYRWMLTRGVAVRDAAGKPIRFVGSSVDITDLKRAEEALRESEQRFRTFVDHATDAFFLFDDAIVVLDVNRQACQSLGYTRDELLGMTPLDFDPDITPARLQAMNRQLYDGQLMAFESRHRRKDGTVFPVEIRGRTFWEGGRRFTVALARDNTERKRAEEALRESEERFRSTFENAAVGIGHRHLDGRFLRVNQKLCTILGYSRDELLQRTGPGITHPDDLALGVDLAEALLRGESPGFTLEKRYLRRDGSPVWVELAVSLQRDGAGKPDYFIGIVQDISNRKRLEAELRQAKEAAEAANRAKDEFLANVSHEIRTPMNAVLGMTELALDTSLTDDQRQCLRTVKSAADNLLGIINDLLDFSKIEAGKLELDPADFSLRATVGDTLRALATRAHKKGLELACNVHPDVPDALVGDAGRLRQMLLNLVGNAIKFTDHGEVVVYVEVAGDPTPEAGAATAPTRSPAVIGEVGLRFTVTDSGIGIPQDKQQRIFRAFEQEDTSTTRKYGGTGLGLTIAARLVALMGGSITVRSEPGRGSTFAFTARFGRQPHPAEQTPDWRPVLLRGLRVLVVDDNPTNRHILQEWLTGWHMEPTAVGDGLAALGALWDAVSVGRPYPLVLLDARMPDTDGLALAARIRERAALSAVRIILLTSDHRPGDPARSRELRIDAHLLKPVQQDDLLETIYRVMSRAQGDAPPAVEEPAREPGPVAAAAPLRILLAEDDEFSAQLMDKLLGRRGHRVRLASNGREALALAGQGAFDLMLLDMHMPELDGIEVVRGVRERERLAGGHLPVVALTARSRKEDRERCLAAGVDDFLTKPVSAAALLAAIDRLVAADVVSRPAQVDAGELIGLLDPVAVLTACGEEGEALRGMCRAFETYLPVRVAEVGDALRAQDAARLREAAHKLCGLLFAFSTTAGNAASDLEDQAAQGRLAEARPLVERLEGMAQELLPLVGGLSLESLRHQAEAAGDPNRASVTSTG